MRYLFLLLFLSTALLTRAQFAAAPGQPGSTAMYWDSSAFAGWANGCTVQRGYINISNPSLGTVSLGSEQDALGLPDGSTVLSLGDSGVAVLTFPYPIQNAAGPDFAVFENGFTNNYLELAFVEVSSDGEHFFRFPAISYIDTLTQLDNFSYSDLTKVHNFAGKYRALYGTPFDLDEVPDDPALNKSAVTHIRLVDVVGSLQAPYRSYDSNGRPVNDPWPTEFASGGFDLDAVGVIHFAFGTGIDEYTHKNELRAWPNPATDFIYIQNIEPGTSYTLVSSTGSVMLNGRSASGTLQLNLAALAPGIYYFKTAQQCIALVKQ